ncbi:hypothetical protein [Providencia phage vB_PreS-Stilesk]|uniref:Uncharacterized protein n=1 Tax=Providencia phage vB_PreS-Stilesk TaxID=2761110 RepID=A0A7G5B165_9CAUD|nr:hypothetical protein JT352_gp59 [Providencia phage vB_PreS-Stilesk]QMV30038.1 hypothetical protein [Providencia phage vB_PreS-Stilesk]
MRDLEKSISICGVNGRMTSYLARDKSKGLFRHQRIVTESRLIEAGEYKGMRIKAELRFDDECGNGHNSFAITGEIVNPRKRGDNAIECCGCIHDEIAEHFPELAHLIKWHLCSTESPVHYVANTCYHASDRDHNGRAKGDPETTIERLQFADFPITFTPKKVLKEFLKGKEGKEINDFELLVTPVPHKDKGTNNYQFDDKYTFAGCNDVSWTYAPFDSIVEAEEFAQAIKQGYSFKKIVTKYATGKERNFEAARSCGVWPDATDEQLSLPREELEKELMARLPALIQKMKDEITGAGFDWEYKE